MRFERLPLHRIGHAHERMFHVNEIAQNRTVILEQAALISRRGRIGLGFHAASDIARTHSYFTKILQLSEARVRATCLSYEAIRVGQGRLGTTLAERLFVENSCATQCSNK